jgi:hypothetical protein
MIYKYLRFVCLLAVAAVLVVLPVHAQSEGLTTEHIATLSQIRTNDAPVYINKNQTYFSIGDKLMARLNSRLTLNSYDASDLVRTSSDYNHELQNFRTQYKAYEELLSDTIHTDCKRDTERFYNKLASTRDARGRVHESAMKLREFISQYGNQVQTFGQQHFSKGVDSE